MARSIIFLIYVKLRPFHAQKFIKYVSYMAISILKLNEWGKKESKQEMKKKAPNDKWPFRNYILHIYTILFHHNMKLIYVVMRYTIPMDWTCIHTHTHKALANNLVCNVMVIENGSFTCLRLYIDT